MQPSRRSSAEVVLAYAFDSSAFTATEAIGATGLTRSTVLAACGELVQLGWLRALDDARAAGEYHKGRPARRYALDDRAGVVVGVDAGQHRVSVAVADLRGTVVGRAVASLGETGLDVDVRLGAVRDAVASAVADAGVDPDRVLVVVVGIPAPVDGRGVSPRDGGYWDRMNPGFASLAGSGRVVVENDANLAALAERPSSGDASFAALLSGERFGAGIVVDGFLLRGPRGGAGEMRVLDLVDGVGSPEGIGATARLLVAEAAERVPAGSLLAGRNGSERLFEAAALGDPVAVEVVDRLGDRLARVSVLLASLLDIDRVVVAGAIADAVGPVLERARVHLAGWDYDPVPELVASRLGADVVVLGAVARALDEVRSEPLALSLPVPPVVSVPLAAG
ncbi:putative NBD/HSP70 family sugar kinase [Curtobacterium luteum]|uniref:NBD/HSP70 family sugar kinase n=1 Tax=Curtobacterium luteum TaxID=33881 RepID=A0A8H9GA33_9MICO|nr:ROK family protein [Curtobacterium luteum]MBM7802396.1 putative NBD/HSP70 family sugar kinase [Curtobacterium luteum]NUU50539.1 ROK family protein [Curtobacterium luteum]GGK92460.1 transcriptional regulator [Curtobacterium luteum]